MCITDNKHSGNTLISIVLIVSLFQENKSFGASTIYIHPLMYVKPCQEHKVFMSQILFQYTEINHPEECKLTPAV